MERFDDNLKFVARYYRRGAFDVSRGLWRLGLRRAVWSGRRVAAGMAAAAVLAASALLYRASTPDVPQTPLHEQAPATPVVHKSCRMEFADMPVRDVAAEIEKAYGVHVQNLPAQDYRLTLSYEGTAEDLVETINELLGTDMRVER